MANLTSNYQYTRAGQEMLPIYRELPGVAATTYYRGGLVYIDPADGKAKRIPAATSAAPAPTLRAYGWAVVEAYTVPAANDALIPVHSGIWEPKFNSTDSAVTTANLLSVVYAENDHTVRADDGGGIYPVAGLCWGFATTGKPQILVGLLDPNAGSAVSAASAFKARGVYYGDVADLTAFDVDNANADGLTYSEGQVVLLVAQTAVSENGPYVVGPVDAGAAPLTRPAWWASGTDVPLGQVIEVYGAGTHYGHSSWKAMATAAAEIDADDPVFYPRQYTQLITLASGTYTIGLGSTATPDEPLFLYSATKSAVSIARGPAGSPHTDTIEYRAATTTSGIAGVAVLTIRADVAAGTINASDASILIVGVTNW